MSRRLILAWMVMAVLGSAVRAQVPFPRDLVPTRTALSRLGLQRQWMAAVPLVRTERVLFISIADGLAFAQTSLGGFYTYDAESGQLLWSTNLGRRLGAALPASANSTRVFVTNSNFLYALDRKTGRTVWTENLQFPPSSPTACDETRVMVGLSTGRVAAFHIRDKSFAFTWQTNGPVIAPPQPAWQVVAVGSNDGKILVALQEPPTMLYRIATEGEIAAPMGTHGTHRLIVPSADKNVYAINLFTADVDWIFPSGAPVMQEPLVAGDDVFVVNTAGILSKLDANGAAKTASPLWSTPTYGGKLLSVSGTRIYLESHDGDLMIVDRASGAMLADAAATHARAGVNLRPYMVGPTNDLNDRLYFGTTSGMILCLREINQFQPRPIRDPKLPPFGYIPPEGVKAPTTAPAPSEAPAPKDEAAPAPAPEGEVK